MPEKAQPRLGIPVPGQERLGYKCIRRADYYGKVYPSTVSKTHTFHLQIGSKIVASGFFLKVWNL